MLDQTTSVGRTDRLSLKAAKRRVFGYGFSLNIRNGEYRLAPIEGTPEEREAQAYYTENLDDAISTAAFEANRS